MWKHFAALGIFATLPLSMSMPADAFYSPISTDCPEWQFEKYVQSIRQKPASELTSEVLLGLPYCGVKAVPILREATGSFHY